MTRAIAFTPDDIFVLGNIGAMAVLRGKGAEALQILQWIQQERPTNAGSFLMHALYLFSEGRTAEAISFLEQSPVFEAEVNRDEAIALHIVLLNYDGQYDRLVHLGEAYLAEGLVQSERAHHVIRTAVDDVLARRGQSARN